jgi:hypothetical protein
MQLHGGEAGSEEGFPLSKSGVSLSPDGAFTNNTHACIPLGIGGLHRVIFCKHRLY